MGIIVIDELHMVSSITLYLCHELYYLLLSPVFFYWTIMKAEQQMVHLDGSHGLLLSTSVNRLVIQEEVIYLNLC